MIEWTSVIVAVVAGMAAGVPATIVALKTKNIVNGRMSDLINASERAAEARALLHERANIAHAKLLRDAVEAGVLIKSTAAAAAAAAAASTVPLEGAVSVTKKEWLDLAQKLLPKLTHGQREELWFDVSNMDAEHALARGKKFINDNL